MRAGRSGLKFVSGRPGAEADRSYHPDPDDVARAAAAKIVVNVGPRGDEDCGAGFRAWATAGVDVGDEELELT
jgi:hypothetical protein